MVQVQSMEDELKKFPELRLEDVEGLRDWARKQPHLPNIDMIPDVFLSLFLRRRYYSLERAKQTLDEFLTFKTLVPEICDNRSYKRAEVQLYFETHYTGILDSADSDGNMVVFIALHEQDTSKYDFVGSMKAFGMVGDAYLLENGGAAGITLVYDQRVLSISHMLQIHLPCVKKINYFNKHCAPISVKNIYIINANNFVQKALFILQQAMEDETFKKIKVFTPSQIEELYKYIPREIVPNDYGGNGPALKQLTEKGMKLIERYDDFFQKFDALKVDESKRSGPEKNMNTMFGLEGTFKKLDVD